MDITAPLYWYKEFDTYKVGTTANSCSTMHKIADHEFSHEDFSCDHLVGTGIVTLDLIIDELNEDRKLYLQTKDKLYWWAMIQLLPTSFMQKRTIDMNYETVINMIHQRSGHKLDEWRTLVEQLEQLPYIEEITAD